MMDSSDAAGRIEAALQANETRKKALLKHIQDLEAQLATVDNLIAKAEAHIDVPDEVESEEDAFVMSVFDAHDAVPPFGVSELEDLRSPFYEQSRRHITYNQLTSNRLWTEAEDAALRDAVQREGMRYHAFQLQNQGYNALIALKDVPLSSYEELRIYLDWERIARYIPGRLPSMCKVRWLAHLHPGVNRGEWSEEERGELMKAVNQAKHLVTAESMDEGVVDWEAVAASVGNGRIAIDCMKAYQALAVAKSAHLTWTPDLDAALLEAVAQHGENNMAKVATSMPISLTRQQCVARHQVLSGKVKAGTWAPEEDAKLEALLEEYPPSTVRRWKVISEAMGTRTERQCRIRFHDALDKSVRRDDWTDAEDQTINSLLASGITIDLPKLAKDLNRPLEKLRKRVGAFSKGQTPSQKYITMAMRARVTKPAGQTSSAVLLESAGQTSPGPSRRSKRSKPAAEMPTAEFAGESDEPDDDSDFEEERSGRQRRARRREQK